MDFYEKIERNSSELAYALKEIKRCGQRVKGQKVDEYIPYSHEEYSKEKYSHLRFI